MRYKKLGSFSVIKSGYAFRGTVLNETGGKIAVIQPRDIASRNSGDYVRVKSGMVPDGHIIDRGAVLITNRGTVCASVFDGGFKAVTTSGVFVVRLGTDSGVLPEFLALYINSDVGQRQIVSKQESMTVPALTIKQVQELEIPMVPIKKQELLSRFYNASQRRNDMILELQKQNTSLMNQIIKGAING